jgi:WD40 repeat protein
VMEGRPIAVTSGGDKTVRMWDLTTSTPIGHPLTGHNRRVNAVACTMLEDRPIAVTGSDDRTVRMWDLTTSTPTGHPLTGHTDTVNAVACTVMEGRPVAVTGSWDNTMRVWDLATGRERYLFIRPERIRAVSFATGGSLLIGFGNEIAFLRHHPR